MMFALLYKVLYQMKPSVSSKVLHALLSVVVVVVVLIRQSTKSKTVIKQ